MEQQLTIFFVEVLNTGEIETLEFLIQAPGHLKEHRDETVYIFTGTKISMMSLFRWLTDIDSVEQLEDILRDELEERNPFSSARPLHVHLRTLLQKIASVKLVTFGTHDCRVQSNFLGGEHNKIALLVLAESEKEYKMNKRY